MPLGRIQFRAGRNIDPRTMTVDDAIDSGIVFAGTPYDVFDQLRAFYDHVGGSGRLLMMGQGDLLDHDETVANLTLLSKECRREFAIREGRNNRENSAKRLPNRDLENAQMRRRY